jgi:hypothetical protein
MKPLRASRLPRVPLTVAIVCFALLAGFATDAEACSCSQSLPCHNVASAHAVFVGIVTSIDDVLEGDPAEMVGSKRAHFKVEQAFRNAAVGETLDVIGGTYSSSCDYVFEKGRRYIVYARREQDQLTTSHCSRTTPIEFGSEDLEFLTNPVKSRDWGRVFGMVRFEGSDPLPEYVNQERWVTGMTVVVRGPGVLRTTETNDKGQFEFLDIPPVPFTVTVVVSPPLSPLGLEEVVEDPDPRACHQLYFGVRYDGRVLGNLRFSSGRPVRGVTVQAIAADTPPNARAFARAQTESNEAGSFELTGLSPGRYLVGVNLARPATVTSPHPAVFVPGTSLSKDARVVEVGPGSHVNVGRTTLPDPLPTVALKSCVVWPDGKPASSARILIAWKRETVTEELYRYEAVGSDGCFSISAHQGTTYNVGASVLIPRDEPPHDLFMANATVQISGVKHAVRLVLKRRCTSTNPPNPFCVDVKQ